MSLPLVRGGSLPVIDRPIDNTAQSAYMACPQEYLLAMVRHRRGSGKSPALTFGGVWHKILQHYYEGHDPIKALEMGLATWKDHGAMGDYRTPQRLMIVFKKYIQKYPTEEDRRATLGYPKNPMVEISAHIQADELIHPYAGKLDRPIRDAAGMVYIEDHKTTSRLDKHTFKSFENSNQMKGYTFLGQKLLPNEKVVGVRINLAHVLKEKTEFHRHYITYSKAEIDEWARNYNRWAYKIALDTLAQLLLDGAEDGEVEQLAIACQISMDNVRLHADLGAFPLHLGDNGCSRKYGLCTFYNVCRAGPHLREKMLEREFEINPWNPLEVDDE